MRKLRTIAVLATAIGLGPAACVADPMLPCESFEAGEADDNEVARAYTGLIAAIAMNDAFVLRNICDADGTCHVDKLELEELEAGSQVMVTARGHHLVGIDRTDGGVWTYDFDDKGLLKSRLQTYVHETDGPAKLVIGLRDSDTLIVRDRQNRLAMYEPGAYKAQALAPALGPYAYLAAVGEEHVALRVPRGERDELYIVDLGEPSPSRNPDEPWSLAAGDFTSVVFGPGDSSLVISEGRGADASVLVFDVGRRMLVDAFEGEVVSSRPENDIRSIEELPGLRAVSPNGEHLAYRTPAGSLAVRDLGNQSSCLVRNTNRLGIDSESNRKAGDHEVAGFSADGVVFAEYTVGAAESHVYAYDPRGQQLVPLGREDGNWHLSAVPGRVTTPSGAVEQLWAVAVRNGNHATIGEGYVNGETVGHELIFMPRADDAIWAIDTDDSVVLDRRNERALSVRRVAAPQRANGSLRFDQDHEEQVVDHYVGEDNIGPLRVPLSGRMCLATGVPGAWAYHCGLTTGNALTITNSGVQEQTSDPNVQPEFDPLADAGPDDDDDDGADANDPDRG